MRGRLRVFGAVFANPDLRRVEIAYMAFGLAEYGTWVAILVFAFEQGGAAEAGLVAVLQLVPAAIVAPFASVFGDRFRRDRVLVTAYAVQAATMGGTAAALLLDAPVPVAYALAAAAATSVTLTRPVQSSLLPSLARTPEELTAANAASGTIESAMILAGPTLAGVLLGVNGLVFAVSSGGLLLGAGLVARVRAQPGPAAVQHDHPVRESVEGLRSVARHPEARVVVGLIAAKSVIDGATDVLCVVVALALLGLDQSGAGYLTAALGAGGVLGGALALGLVGRRRLAPALVLGVIAFGVPVAFIGLTREAFLAGALLAAGGVGFTVTDVAGRTLLQRVVSDQSWRECSACSRGSTWPRWPWGRSWRPCSSSCSASREGSQPSGSFCPSPLFYCGDRSEAPTASRAFPAPSSRFSDRYVRPAPRPDAGRSGVAAILCGRSGGHRGDPRGGARRSLLRDRRG